MTATVLGFAAGCLAALAVADLARALAPVHRQAPALTRRIGALAETLRRPGSEGRDPDAGERRRLLVASGATAFATGTLILGPVPGIVAGIAAPLGARRVLAGRRERYRRGVAEGAAQIAVALADALGAGHSVRGAIMEAAPGIPGPPGSELRRVASELALGARTEEALEGLRRRARAHQIDAIVAGILLARRAGGDLAGLLRHSARAFEDQARLVGEVRAATAQARFTGVVVVLLPLGGAVLAELASPGFIAGLADGFLTVWLVGIALAMQAIAAFAIRRLGRVRE